MVDKTTLKIVERLAPFAGRIAANPLNLLVDMGKATGDAAARQRRALDLLHKEAEPDLMPGNEAWLLHANHSPVPFDFRDAEMADFKEWFFDTDGNRFLKWRLVTGGSGRGKTRFAREFIRSLKHEMGDHLIGGFVDTTAVSARPDDLSGFLDVRGDVLMIVDYAERFHDAVALLLHATLAMEQKLKPGFERRIRVILISRSSTEVWDRMGSRYPQIALFRARLNGGLEICPLAPLAETREERNIAFTAAYEAFDAYFTTHWTDIHSRPMPHPLPDLSDDAFKDVLLIHLAALAIWHDGAQVGDVSRDNLLGWLLSRERNAWDRLLDDRGLDATLQGPPIEQVATLLTYVSLGGEGISGRSRAVELLKACPLMDGLPNPTLSAIADIFRELYPGPAWVNGVTPDLVGQYLLRVAEDEFLDEFDGDLDEA